MKEGGIFKADAEYNERKNKNGVYRDKMRVLLFFSEMIIPLILFYVVGFGVLMKCDIYEEFVKGAKEGLETVIQILPTLIGLMVAVGVEDITAETLAGLSGVSVQHFCRVFKAETSMRPLEYIAKRRISQAKSLLLNTDSDIGDIGKQVGYEDRNYFSIVFKKLEGVSPREYRRSRGTGL